MLYDIYKKLAAFIRQWFETIFSGITPAPALVRIRSKEAELMVYRSELNRRSRRFRGR